MPFVSLIHLCDLETSGIDPLACGIHEICSVFVGYDSEGSGPPTEVTKEHWETLREALAGLVVTAREEQARWLKRWGNGKARSLFFPTPGWEEAKSPQDRTVFEATLDLGQGLLAKVSRMRFGGTSGFEEKDPEAYQVNGFSPEEMSDFEDLCEAMSEVYLTAVESDLNLQKDCIEGDKISRSFEERLVMNYMDNLPAFFEWLRYTYRSPAYVGHNTSFDQAFLLEAYRKGNVAIYAATSFGNQVRFPFTARNPFRKAVFDTRTDTAINKLQNTGLRAYGKTSEHPGVVALAQEKTHDGLVDVLLLVEALCQREPMRSAVVNMALEGIKGIEQGRH